MGWFVLAVLLTLYLWLRRRWARANAAATAAQKQQRESQSPVATDANGTELPLSPLSATGSRALLDIESSEAARSSRAESALSGVAIAIAAGEDAAQCQPASAHAQIRAEEKQEEVKFWARRCRFTACFQACLETDC